MGGASRSGSPEPPAGPAILPGCASSPTFSACASSATSGSRASPPTPATGCRSSPSGWLILQATDSPAAVGALALVTRAPAIALSAYAGRLADRHDRRLVGIWTFLLQAVAAGALAVITFTSGVHVDRDLRPHLPDRRRLRPGPAGHAGADPVAGAAPAALPGRQPERRRHQRRPPARAGDRRPHPGGLRGDGLLRAQRPLVPRAGRSAPRPAAPPRSRRQLGGADARGVRRGDARPGPAASAPRHGALHRPRLADPGARAGGGRPSRCRCRGPRPAARGDGRRRAGRRLAARAARRRGHAPAPGAADRLARVLGRPRGGRRDALVRARPRRHGLQRRLLDLDVRRDQHRHPATRAPGPARADARSLPALGDRADRHRIDPRRGRSPRPPASRRRWPGARCCSPCGAHGASVIRSRRSTTTSRRRPRAGSADEGGDRVEHPGRDPALDL